MPLSLLNEQQRGAALAPRGYNLVIASAGTGKTSTIVGRIAHLLEEGVSPAQILLLTFTNKAAQEMLSRLGMRFDSSIVKQIEAGTFHAVSYRYLKSKTPLTLKQPRELKILFKSLYDEHILNRFSQTQPYGANYLYDLFSLFFNATTSLDFKSWLASRNEEHLEFAEMYWQVWQEFQTLKEQYHYADYNDLLLLYRQKIKEDNLQFQEILVDEYQDTNPLQDSILSAFNPPSIFCVGDYDQSIYAFNGADISIIGSFKERYPQGRIYSLTKNYRSSESILSLANRVIERNPRIYPKTLEVVKTQDFGRPTLLVYDELFLQYQGIAHKIKLTNRHFSDIAVIFRNNSSADGIEACLRELGIPSRRRGGVSFFETKEITFLLNCASLLFNPKDMMAFIHILSYAKGIGEVMAKEIYEGLLVLGEGNPILGLLKPIKTLQNPYPKKSQIQRGLFDDEINQDFLELPEEFRTNPILQHSKITKEAASFLNALYDFFKISQKTQKPDTIIARLCELPLFAMIAKKLAKERSITKEGKINEQKYNESLERIYTKSKLLCDLAHHYEELGRFLNAMILGSSEMSEGEGVNLLSIHASKGLEFSEVYIVDLMEGRFPNKKLISQGGSLEEERRLFYVAVTRAKENLYLSYAKKDALKNLTYEGSIFLYEAGMLQSKSL